MQLFDWLVSAVSLELSVEAEEEKRKKIKKNKKILNLKINLTPKLNWSFISIFPLPLYHV